MNGRTLMTFINRSTLILGIILSGGMFLSSWFTEAAEAAPQRGGRVEGMVVSAETGAPLAGVEVWLDRMADPELSPRRKAVTNEAGVFVFRRVHPGNYRLYAQKTGYLIADYLQQQQTELGTLLEIGEGSLITNVHINLAMGGKISGLVLDEQGQPAVDMIVKLLELNTTSNEVATVSVVSTKTDQEGRYLLQGIRPGGYVLRAERRHINKSDAQLEFAYYPEADSWRSATPMEINAGDILADVNLMFTPRSEQPVITGTITDALTGQPLANAHVDLVDGSNLGLQAKTDENGAFRLIGMPAGRYTVSAHAEMVGDGYEWKLKRVAVEPGDNTVNFRLNPAPQVTATVEYIGSGPAPATGDFMVSVRVDTNARGITYNGQETFQFRGLKSGKTHIGVGFAALQYKLAAVLVDEQDVTGQTLTLRPGDKLTNVRILITDEPTSSVKSEQ